MNWWDCIDDMYINRSNANIEVGDIVLCPTICWDMRRKILNVSRATTGQETHQLINISIEDYDKANHYRGEAKTLPIYNLGLKKTEEFVLDRTKMRPCVVLKCDAEKIPQNGEYDNAVQLLNQSMLTLLPIYGFEKAPEITKYNPKTIHRIKWLQYDKLFFMPKSQGLAITKDSFARLDMIFQIPARHICTRTNTKLGSVFLNLLQLYVLNYLGFGYTEEEYKDVSEIISLAHECFQEIDA